MIRIPFPLSPPHPHTHHHHHQQQQQQQLKMPPPSRDPQMKLLQEFMAWQASGGSDDPFGAETRTGTVKREAFFEIWAEVRLLASQNGASFGMEHLDTLVKAVVLREDTSTLALGGNVLLLQAPSEMRVGAAPQDDDFATPVVTVNRGKRSRNASANDSPTKTVRMGTPTKTASTRSPPKKRRTTVLIPKSSSTRTVLAQNAPAQVQADWNALRIKAAKEGKTPARMAYPWAGRRLWYDPEIFPDIYRAHYQFWMKHRRTFWNWTMHFPLASGSANGARRKAKMCAIRDRLIFLSLCIETWGWYGFMERWDDTDHDSVLWLGGREGKRAGKNPKGKAVESLANILKVDSERYDAIIKRALDPETIDADGYAGVQEMLEQTGALNPATKTPANHLSARALARIRIDVRNGTPKRSRWKGVWVKSPWRELMASPRLDRVQESVERELKRNTLSVTCF